MIGFFVLLAVAQAGLEVTATVDRVRLVAGEELTLTVQARTRRGEPVELVLPPIVGFAVVGSRDATEMSLGAGAPVRTTIRELTLRADRPGRLVIGPVEARQGAARVRTEAMTLMVDHAAARAAVTPGPRAQALLDAAAAPPGDRVALSVIASSDTALVGEQVDILVVAWFPRALRDRLRRPPAVTLPAGAGAWVLPQPVDSGVAVSRRAAAGWVDGYVLHHILFPLAPGRVVIPPASVSYALPLFASYFSREERLTLAADSLVIVVAPLPAGGAGMDTPSVVGAGVTLDVSLSTHQTRVGELIEVSTRVAGAGNVPLWVEPQLEWPAGFRAYPAGAVEETAVRDGRVSGHKTFRAIVVADSVGRFVLPDVRYPYYDLSTGRHDVAVVPARTLAVAPPTGPQVARSAPSLLASGRAGWADRLLGLGPPLWATVWVLPPVLAALVRRRSRTAAVPVGRASPAEVSRLGRLERDFDAVLTSQVPDHRARYGAGLAPALRAAGLEGATADHVVRLRDRLRAARYGPQGAGDERTLTAELERVLAVLGDARRGGACGAAAACGRGPGRSSARWRSSSSRALRLRRSRPTNCMTRGRSGRRRTRSRPAPRPGRRWPRTGTIWGRRCIARGPMARRRRRGPSPHDGLRATRWCGARAACSRRPTSPVRGSWRAGR